MTDRTSTTVNTLATVKNTEAHLTPLLSIAKSYKTLKKKKRKYQAETELRNATFTRLVTSQDGMVGK